MDDPRLTLDLIPRHHLKPVICKTSVACFRSFSSLEADMARCHHWSHSDPSSTSNGSTEPRKLSLKSARGVGQARELPPASYARVAQISSRTSSPLASCNEVSSLPKSHVQLASSPPAPNTRPAKGHRSRPGRTHEGSAFAKPRVLSYVLFVQTSSRRRDSPTSQLGESAPSLPATLLAGLCFSSFDEIADTQNT